MIVWKIKILRICKLFSLNFKNLWIWLLFYYLIGEIFVVFNLLNTLITKLLVNFLTLFDFLLNIKINDLHLTFLIAKYTLMRASFSSLAWTIISYNFSWVFWSRGAGIYPAFFLRKESINTFILSSFCMAWVVLDIDENTLELVLSS